MDIDHNFNSIGWPDQVDRVQIFEFQILADSINGQDHLDRVQRYGSPPLNFEFSKLGAEVGHPTVLLCPPLSFFCTICVSPLQRFLYLLLPLSFPITHFFLLQPPISYPFLLYKLENTSLSLSHYSFPLLTTRNRLSLSSFALPSLYKFKRFSSHSFKAPAISSPIYLAFKMHFRPSTRLFIHRARFDFGLLISLNVCLKSLDVSLAWLFLLVNCS